ncbi:MAG: carbohydrate ABC transporter permease [Eubacteriales bacterium]|nr:carbohydrate ABC transporter permease [Eubacteriales bacterium]MDD4326788.1 carbohydrate ABC transporter permease [Eubacteriales bacterium]MDD4716933.1 carbohydrate ABC transporter permease [Eubacteriales bacterium]
MEKKFVKYIWSVTRFVIVFGLAFIILKPFIYKILMAFMSPEDLLDSTVRLVPKNFSLYYWKVALEGLELDITGWLTFIMSFSVGIFQTFVCSMIAYGLARFKFRGNRLAFMAVIVIMLIPPQVYSIAQYLRFTNFNYGIGGSALNLTDSLIPLYILALTGLGLKEGLYIYLMRSFYMSLPKDLENAAYIDGASPISTFFRVILPNSRTILTTVFLFSFAWQWTDVSYPSLYFSEMAVLATKIPNIYIRIGLSADPLGSNIAQNAAGMLAMIPLLVLYGFSQKALVNSIVRTGNAN